MVTHVRPHRFGFVLLTAFFAIPAGLLAQLPFAGVSLKVSREIAPPGGIAQIKVSITEPKPISTGGMFFDFGGGDDFVGIAAMSPQNDAYGVADIAGSRIGFSIVSPTASVGMASDYPILTVAARINPTTPLHTTFQSSIDAAGLRLVGPNGIVYPTEIENGTVTVDNGISIEDVTPGSADLPAGAVVTIVGRGFRPSTRVRFGEVRLASVRYVDSTHIQAVLGAAARMHGMRIRAENTDGAKTTYFSYQRTRRQGISAFPALQHLVPLFPLRATTRAIVPVRAVSTAVALQNISDVAAPVILQLLSPAGRVLGSTVVQVGRNRFTLDEVSELFGVSYSPPGSVRVISVVPIQVLGVEIIASGEATAFAPQS